MEFQNIDIEAILQKQQTLLQEIQKFGINFKINDEEDACELKEDKYDDDQLDNYPILQIDNTNYLVIQRYVFKISLGTKYYDWPYIGTINYNPENTKKCMKCKEFDPSVDLACCDCSVEWCKSCRDTYEVCECYGDCSGCGKDVNRGENGWPCNTCKKWLCENCNSKYGCNECKWENNEGQKEESNIKGDVEDDLEDEEDA